MDDCLIIGGGVIGLSLACELAAQGMRVRVLERGQPGREASWAGAGIIPSGNDSPGSSPLDALGAWSSKLHREWSAQLLAETGIDNGFRLCGGLYVAREGTSVPPAIPVAAQPVDLHALADLEPALNRDGSIGAAWLDRAEAQIRNPWHLRGLLARCARLGVTIDCGAVVDDFVVRQGRVVETVTTLGRLPAGCVCVTSGAWSRTLLARLGCELSLRPIHGQMLLLATRPGLLRQIINEGPRYLVPRNDGRLLVGSTEEDIGFVKQNTAAATGELLQLAIGLVPQLAGARLEACWAGLRPATDDRRPVLGPLPELSNAYVATGHFRSGLHLSPATAVLMAQLIRGQRPALDVTSFAPRRPGAIAESSRHETA